MAPKSGDPSELKFEAVPFHAQQCTILPAGSPQKLSEFFTKASSYSNAESRSFWMKIHFPATKGDDYTSESGFYFFAMDMVSGNSWYQHETSLSAVVGKAESCNPGLEMEEELLVEHISNAVNGKSRARWRFMASDHERSRTTAQHSSKAQLGFRVIIGASIAFDFDFDCVSASSSANKAGIQLTFAHVIQPLMMMVNYSLEAEKEVVSIIQTKDKEIEDYKFQGAKPSRGNVASAPFDLPQLQRELLSGSSVSTLSNSSSSTDLMKLYGVITAARLNQNTDTAHNESPKRNRSESPKKKEEAIPAKSSPKKPASSAKAVKKDTAAPDSEEDDRPAPVARRVSSRTPAAKATVPETPVEPAKKPPVKKKRGFM